MKISPLLEHKNIVVCKYCIGQKQTSKNDPISNIKWDWMADLKEYDKINFHQTSLKANSPEYKGDWLNPKLALI